MFAAVDHSDFEKYGEKAIINNTVCYFFHNNLNVIDLSNKHIGTHLPWKIHLRIITCFVVWKKRPTPKSKVSMLLIKKSDAIIDLVAFERVAYSDTPSAYHYILFAHSAHLICANIAIKFVFSSAQAVFRLIQWLKKFFFSLFRCNSLCLYFCHFIFVVYPLMEFPAQPIQRNFNCVSV